MDNEKMVEAVIKAQGNDVNAFAELFLGYKDTTYYVAKKMFPDENKALNIVYESCISMFRQLKTLNPASAFQLWINMIAGSVIKRRLTADEQALLAPVGGDNAPLGTNEDANAQISRAAFDNDETKSMICSIVDALPVDQKLCALLYYFCGLKVEYIAQALGTTPIAAQNRIFSATNKIKEGMYGFGNKGEKLYAVPAWLIASAMLAQSGKMTVNPATTQQVFSAATQAVAGKAITPPAIAAYVESQRAAEAAALETAAHTEVSDLVAETPSYESVNLDKIKERDYDRFENEDMDDEDEPRSRKGKKTGGKKKRPGLTVLIVLLVLAALAAGAIFGLPKLTDGKIDPLAMVMSLFSNPEKQLAEADTLMQAGDYAGAAVILEKLAEKDSANSNLYFKLIKCYEQLGDNAKAVSAYKNYFALEPRSKDLTLYANYIKIAQDEPIAWVDEQFGALIATALNKDSVTPADLANVTELYIVGDSKAYIDAQSYANDLTSYEFAVDANEKRIGYNYGGAEKGIASYASFADLLNFANLRSLSFDFVNYGNLDAVLKFKTDLTTLRFSGCQLGIVPDFTALTSLTSLSITHDTVSDISPVATLSSLTELDLSYNAITNITALETLTGLTRLDLFSNTIEDVTPLAALTALVELDLGRNEIEDFDALDDLEFEDDMYNDDDQFWEPEEVNE